MLRQSANKIEEKMDEWRER